MIILVSQIIFAIYLKCFGNWVAYGIIVLHYIESAMNYCESTASFRKMLYTYPYRTKVIAMYKLSYLNERCNRTELASYRL